MSENEPKANAIGTFYQELKSANEHLSPFEMAKIIKESLGESVAIMLCNQIALQVTEKA